MGQDPSVEWVNKLREILKQKTKEKQEAESEYYLLHSQIQAKLALAMPLPGDVPKLLADANALAAQNRFELAADTLNTASRRVNECVENAKFDLQKKLDVLAPIIDRLHATFPFLAALKEAVQKFLSEGNFLTARVAVLELQNQVVACGRTKPPEPTEAQVKARDACMSTFGSTLQMAVKMIPLSTEVAANLNLLQKQINDQQFKDAIDLQQVIIQQCGSVYQNLHKELSLRALRLNETLSKVGPEGQGSKVAVQQLMANITLENIARVKESIEGFETLANEQLVALRSQYVRLCSQEQSVNSALPYDGQLKVLVAEAREAAASEQMSIAISKQLAAIQRADNLVADEAAWVKKYKTQWSSTAEALPDGLPCKLTYDKAAKLADSQNYFEARYLFDSILPQLIRFKEKTAAATATDRNVRSEVSKILSDSRTFMPVEVRKLWSEALSETGENISNSAPEHLQRTLELRDRLLADCQRAVVIADRVQAEWSEIQARLTTLPDSPACAALRDRAKLLAPFIQQCYFEQFETAVSDLLREITAVVDGQPQTESASASPEQLVTSVLNDIGALLDRLTIMQEPGKPMWLVDRKHADTCAKLLENAYSNLEKRAASFDDLLRQALTIQKEAKRLDVAAKMSLAELNAVKQEIEALISEAPFNTPMLKAIDTYAGLLNKPSLVIKELISGLKQFMYVELMNALKNSASSDSQPVLVSEEERYSDLEKKFNDLVPPPTLQALKGDVLKNATELRKTGKLSQAIATLEAGIKALDLEIKRYAKYQHMFALLGTDISKKMQKVANSLDKELAAGLNAEYGLLPKSLQPDRAEANCHQLRAFQARLDTMIDEQFRASEKVRKTMDEIKGLVQLWKQPMLPSWNSQLAVLNSLTKQWRYNEADPLSLQLLAEIKDAFEKQQLPEDATDSVAPYRKVIQSKLQQMKAMIDELSYQTADGETLDLVESNVSQSLRFRYDYLMKQAEQL